MKFQGKEAVIDYLKNTQSTYEYFVKKLEDTMKDDESKLLTKEEVEIIESEENDLNED